jgi:hypothetical protein
MRGSMETRTAYKAALPRPINKTSQTETLRRLSVLDGDKILPTVRLPAEP